MVNKLQSYDPMISGKLEAIEESEINHFDTSTLFKNTYPNKKDQFSASYFSWRYERQFQNGTHSVSIYHENMKIAQATIFRQTIRLAGELYPLAQLGDLAVHPKYRSFETVSALYRMLNTIISREKYGAIITVPNGRSLSFNKRFLKLLNVRKIQFHMGICLPSFFPAPVVHHERCRDKFPLSKEAATLLQGYLNTHTENKVSWSPASLHDRMLDPRFTYELHWLNDFGIITTKHRIYGIPYFMIRAIINNSSDIATTKQWRKLLGQVARKYRTPLWLYWGISHGFENLRKASLFQRELQKSLQLQYSDLIEEASGIDHIELIDIDVL